MLPWMSNKARSWLGYLEGAAGAHVKHGSLPVGALLTGLGPHHRLHGGNAPDPQENVEGPCERRGETQLNKPAARLVDLPHVFLIGQNVSVLEEKEIQH